MESENSGVIDAPKHPRRALRLTMIAVILFVAASIGIWWHKHSINSVVETALAGETGAETSVYRRGLLGDDIVFDVKSVEGQMSMVDMTRRLLKTAEALKDDDFSRVFLAYQGAEKFYLDGTYFKSIGEEREWQNPVYTIRTMPSNVHKLNGSPAFGSWSGGLIGVIGEEMNDNAEFHKEWWVNDAIKGLPGQ
jgi:hypothetical protein